jgi:23S rRNA pseudouridine1911/1915/1917 synthase
MAKSDVGANRIAVVVPRTAAGTRLDAFIAGAVADLSRVRAKSLILDGKVTIGGATIVEPRRTVKSGDRVEFTVPPPLPAKPTAERIPLDIVYEDADIIVIDKPAGLVVHPAAGNWSGTLVNALIAHCGDSLSGIGGVRRPGIVHRLDKDTSGLMVAAKNDRAHQALAAEFADHGRTGSLVRGYKAVVWGAPEPREGTIDAPISRSARNRQKMRIVKSGGRRAVTHYETRQVFGPKAAPWAALVDCRLETGRTHQIRVHLAAAGHPLLGDPLYGAGFQTKAALLPDEAKSALRALGRQALHAHLLGFKHPVTGELLRFERPPPPPMAELIAALTKA